MIFVPKIAYNKTLKKIKHYCGNGFSGVIIQKNVKLEGAFGETLINKKATFCNFCGKETRN